MVIAVIQIILMVSTHYFIILKQIFLFKIHGSVALTILIIAHSLILNVLKHNMLRINFELTHSS